LSYLASQQNPDGSFAADGPRVALSALCLISFLSSGHTPDLGRYGLHLRKTVDFLLASVPPDGYVGQIDGSRMYGQGVVALALAEVSGVEPDPARRAQIQSTLAKMIHVILAAQSIQKPDPYQGGWRYEPQSGDSDLSLSGWCALALRAARDAGQNIPKESIDRALAFVLRCYNKDDGGFSYSPGPASSPAMTAVGVVNLSLLGALDRPELPFAGRYLREHPVNDQTRFPYYSVYYATQAAHQLGDPTWSLVWNNTRNHLLPKQLPDGSWPQSSSGEEPGTLYATAMSLLSLSVPYRLLPIYQR
jgi:hypothetical protein